MKESQIKGRALVIGAGVSGMTTAACLRLAGIDTILVGEQFMPQITSAVAGALWEWPPAVCGYHHDEVSLARSKQWCMVSFRMFEKLAASPEAGVYIRPVTFYFRSKVEEHALHLEKMQEMRVHVPGFKRDASLIQQNGVNRQIGLVDAYQHLAPMVDTDRYMSWLTARVRAAGVRIVQRRIVGDLRANERAIQDEFGVDVVVNCSGLGARELAGEAMYPLRGAVVRIVNDGKRFPKLTQAHCVSHDHVTSDQEIVFIVPRGDDRIVLGALAEADQWDTGINLDNHEPIRRMYERCLDFLPMLREGIVDPVEPVRAGLRPFRKRNVRVEEEVDSTIIHNYAHGGAGVTFSWGCAIEVAQRVERMLAAGRSKFTGAEIEPAAIDSAMMDAFA